MDGSTLEAYIAANVTPPMYTTTLAAGVPIRALDISELRNAVANIN